MSLASYRAAPSRGEIIASPWKQPQVLFEVFCKIFSTRIQRYTNPSLTIRNAVDSYLNIRLNRFIPDNELV